MTYDDPMHLSKSVVAKQIVAHKEADITAGWLFADEDFVTVEWAFAAVVKQEYWCPGSEPLYKDWSIDCKDNA